MRLLAALLGLLLVAGLPGPALAVERQGPPAFTVSATADHQYVVVGSDVTVTGTVAPAAPWRPVDLQVRGDGGWRTVATATLDQHSRYTVSATLDALGDQRLRVVKPARGAIAAGVSPVLRVNVSTVQLADETVILTDEDTAHVVSFDLTTGLLQLDATADVAGATIGTIFAAGYSEQTPDGLLRRVTSVARTPDGGWLFGTEQASLDQAIVRTVGQEHVTGTVVQQQVDPARGVTLNGRRTAQSWSGSVALPSLGFAYKHTFDISTPKPEDGFGLYGQGSLELSAEIQLQSSGEMVWDQDWFTVKRVRAAFHTATTTKLAATVKGQVGGKLVATLGDIHRFYEFMIGPVPVVFEDTTDLPLEVEVLAGGSAEASFEGVDTAAVGFDYQKDNGGFSPVWEKDGSHDGTVFDPKGLVEIEGTVGLKETVKAYAVAGVTGAVKGYGKYEYGVDESGRSCPITAGLRIEGGVVGGIDLFVHDLEWEWTQEAELELFRYDDCALNPHIATTTLDDGTVGHEYSQQLELEEEHDGFWTSEDQLPPGLELSSTGVLSGTPEKEGTYQLHVLFTGLDGRTGRATLTLVVVKPAIVVATTSLPDGVVGLPYAGQLSALGGQGPFTWTVLHGSVPGLTIGPDGAITGTPTGAGSGTLTVRVVDHDGLVATGDVTWVVSDLPPPVPVKPIPPITQPPSCGAACGTSWGDPHLVTFDGLSYDAQRVGELVLTKSRVDDFEVQVRQQPWQGSQLVAVNTATAMSVAGHRVGIYLTPSGVRTLVDGEAVALGADAVSLPGGGSIRLDAAGRLETVTWPDGTSLTASYVPGSYITVRLGIPSARLGHLTGLLGDADGNRADDLTTRAGDVVPTGSPVGTVLSQFVDTWRIGRAESLFDYEAGQDTDSFTDPAFPYVHVTVSDLPAAQADAAFSSCQASGVVGQDALDDCALDVALSGDPVMATGALVMQSGTGAGDAAANGGFEQPAIGSRFVSLGAGATVGAWTVESGSIDLVHNDYWQPASGSQSIDLNSCSPGRISQRMIVQPGQRYRIAYSYAGNPETSDRLKKFHVEVDGVVVDRRTFDTTGRTTGSMGWTPGVTSFVATGDTATVAFQSDQLGSCGGATLDDIAITPVSTPSSVIASSSNGDAWTDQSGMTGTAELSYGHIGCTALDSALHCVSGGWAVLADAPWIWAHQFTRNGEGSVTFTRTVVLTEAQASHQLRLTALGDDVMTAGVDGQQVLSGGFSSPTSADLSLAPGEHTLTFVVTNLGGYQPNNNPAGLAWKLRTVD